MKLKEAFRFVRYLCAQFVVGGFLVLLIIISIAEIYRHGFGNYLDGFGYFMLGLMLIVTLVSDALQAAYKQQRSPFEFTWPTLDDFPDKEFQSELNSLLHAKFFIFLFLALMFFVFLFIFVIDPSAYPAWWRGYIDWVDRLSPGLQGSVIYYGRVAKEGVPACYAAGTLAGLLSLLYVMKFIVMDKIMRGKKDFFSLSMRKATNSSPVRFYSWAALCLLFLTGFVFNSATEPSTGRLLNVVTFCLQYSIWIGIPIMLYYIFHSLLCDLKQLFSKLFSRGKAT